MDPNADPEVNPQVQAALDKLEEASSAIAIAGTEPSTVEGYADPWNSIMTLHSAVRQGWRNLADHESEDLE